MANRDQTDQDLDHAIRELEAQREAHDLNSPASVLNPGHLQRSNARAAIVRRIQELNNEKEQRERDRVSQAAELEAEKRASHRAAIEEERSLRRERLLRLEAANLDDAAFWSRRFYTTLGIANAAAFAAIASGFLQAETNDRKPVVQPVADALEFFMWGMVLAGVIPLLNWIKSERNRIEGHFDRATDAGIRMAILWLSVSFAALAAFNSAVFFVLGLASAIGGIRGLGG